MKRISAMILAISLLLLCGTSALAASPPDTEAEAKPLLSEMDEDQCMEILSDLGVTIPPELKDVKIAKMVEVIEANPNGPAAINDPILAQLYNDVQSAVREYYQMKAPPAFGLVYSTVYQWNAAFMGKYNCYAYVIGRSNSFFRPGDFSDKSYNEAAGISDLADVVKADLQGGLGYSCVKIQGSRPSSTSGWSNVIAVRKDINNDIGSNDFHFAQLSVSDWYHKPSDTAVLKFNNAPTNSVVWTNECYRDGYYWGPCIWYESNIMYLLYKSSHGSTTYTWTGKDYHSGSKHFYEYGYLCSDCGEYTNTVWTSAPCSGPPCATPWSLNPTPEVS